MKRACACLMCALILAAPVAAQTGTAEKKSVKETAKATVEDRTDLMRQATAAGVWPR